MIDRSKIKNIFTINLKDYKDAKEIKTPLRDREVKKYVYTFISIFGVMKFGSSKNKEWEKGQYGDRIYRQAHHIPGWATTQAGKNTSGDDFIPVINQYPTLTKDQVLIKVWDMTDYPFLSSVAPKELEEFENELIQDYVSLFGVRPIGNKKDMSYASNISVVSDLTFTTFFTLEDA